MCYNDIGDSMLPSKVIYKDKMYETVGFIKLNNGSFLILKNNDEIISIDLSKAQGLSLKLKFEVKEATKVELVLIEYITQALRNDIKNGKYKDKKSLMDDLASVNKYINTHPELLKNMKELDFKDDLVDKNILQLLSYFDEVMAPSPLNLESITSFEIGDKDYIKFKDENGDVKILDDSHDNRNFVEQFENKQDESRSFQSNDGTQNALEIAKDTLKYEKKEVPLESTVLDDNLGNAIINQQPALANDNILGNSEEKIFYNQSDNQIVTIEQNGDDVAIKEVGETKSVEEKDEDTTSKVIYPPYDEVTVTLLLFKGPDSLDVDLFINQYLNYLTVKQIDLLISNYILTPEQMNKLTEQRLIKEMAEKQVEDVKQMEKPKTLVLKKNDKAAFVDSLLLSFVVGLVWGIYLTFLIILLLS